MMFDNPWARTYDEFMTPLTFSALLVLFFFISFILFVRILWECFRSYFPHSAPWKGGLGLKLAILKIYQWERNFLQVYFIEISILKQDHKTDDMVLTTYFMLDWIVSSLCG